MGGWSSLPWCCAKWHHHSQKRKRSPIRDHRKAYHRGIGILSFTEFVEISMDSGKNIDQIKKEWAQLPSAVGRTVGNLKHHEVLARQGLNPGAAGNRQKRHLIWTCVGEGRLPTKRDGVLAHREHKECACCTAVILDVSCFLFVVCCL